MTPGSLKQLLEEATPGQWRSREGDVYALDSDHSESGYRELHDDFFHNEKDAELAALAPDLARIVIEQHRALERVLQEWDERGEVSDDAYDAGDASYRLLDGLGQ